MMHKMDHSTVVEMCFLNIFSMLGSWDRTKLIIYQFYFLMLFIFEPIIEVLILGSSSLVIKRRGKTVLRQIC